MKMDQDHSELRVEIGHISYEGSRHVTEEHPDKAVECFYTAYQKSRKLEDDSTERICAFNLGAAYIASGEAEKGLEFLHKAKPPGSQKDGRSNGDLYFNMAFGYEKLDDLKTALGHYELACAEFKLERDNVAMELQCLEKCLQIQQKWKRHCDAAEVCRQMAELHGVQGNTVKQAECLYCMASQYRYDNNKEQASSSAKDCLNLLSGFTPKGTENTASGKILNDLGLVYTQLQSYNEACLCFEKALELVHQGSSESKQLEAVILQNLGAAYNFQGDYQRAVKFHEDAADKYAKLHYRNGQGQCFTNLAFALSQLGEGELKGAELAFHHALQASKDTGDKNMKWQALEGLGTVNFNQGNYRDATKFFQEALKTVGENKEAGERIVEKLTHVIEHDLSNRQPQGAMRYTPYGDGYLVNIQQQHQQQQQVLQQQQMRPGVNASAEYGSGGFPAPVQEVPIVPQQYVPVAGEQPMMSQVQETERPPSRKEQRRIMRLRKKESIGPHFPKIFNGLSESSITPRPGSAYSAYGYGSPRFKSMSSQQLGLLEETDSDSDSDTDSSSDDKKSESSESSSTDSMDNDESELEKEDELMHSAKIEKIFSRSEQGQRQRDSPDLDAQQKYQRMLQQKEEEAEKASESEDSDDDDDSSDDEETNQRAAAPPTLPAQSPPNTGSKVSTQDLGTYIKPVTQVNKHSDSPHPRSQRSSEGHHVNTKVKGQGQNNKDSESDTDEDPPYATIGTIRKTRDEQKNGEGNEIISFNRNEENNIGLNRFSSEDSRTGGNFFDNSEGSQNGQSDLGDDVNQSKDQDVTRGGSGNDNLGELDRSDHNVDLHSLPRGQRELILHEQHQKRAQEQKDQAPALPPRGEEKSSKTCVIM